MQLQIIGIAEVFRYIDSKISLRKGEALCMGYHTEKIFNMEGYAIILQIFSEWFFLQFLQHSKDSRVLSILLCKIFISQFFEERQIFTHFTYRV